MKTLTLIFTVLTVLILNFSCVGPAGRDGIDGIDGQDGIANVGAAIYDVEPSAWTGNVDGFVTTLNVPEITQYVYENGAVLIYVLKNEGSADQSFNQLPYTWLNGSMTEYMDYDAYLGSIDINLRWTDNGVNSTEAPTGNYAFKVIVIEGTPLSVLATQTDISNPDAVMSYFGKGGTAF